MKSETFFALIAGAAAGFVAGVLLAPDKGAQTREKVKDGADEVKDKVLAGLAKLETAITGEDYTTAEDIPDPENQI